MINADVKYTKIRFLYSIQWLCTNIEFCDSFYPPLLIMFILLNRAVNLWWFDWKLWMWVNSTCLKWHMTQEADPGFQPRFSGSPAAGVITSFSPALFGPPSQTPVRLSTEVRLRDSSEHPLTAPSRMDSYAAQNWMEDLWKSSSVQHWQYTAGSHHGPWKSFIQIPENDARNNDDVQTR